MKDELQGLAAYLNGRGLSAPDAVALLTQMTGEILASAHRAGHTDSGEIERTVAKMAAAIRQHTGVSAGAAH